MPLLLYYFGMGKEQGAYELRFQLLNLEFIRRLLTCKINVIYYNIFENVFSILKKYSNFHQHFFTKKKWNFLPVSQVSCGDLSAPVPRDPFLVKLSRGHHSNCGWQSVRIEPGSRTRDERLQQIYNYELCPPTFLKTIAIIIIQRNISTKCYFSDFHITISRVALLYTGEQIACSPSACMTRSSLVRETRGSIPSVKITIKTTIKHWRSNCLHPMSNNDHTLTIKMTIIVKKNTPNRHFDHQ